MAAVGIHHQDPFPYHRVGIQFPVDVRVNLARAAGLVLEGRGEVTSVDSAGPDNNWVPPGDPRVIANTVLIGPGESTEVTFTAPESGTYQFVCTFPGHNFTMFGDFVVN